jgi:hypothetical protein
VGFILRNKTSKKVVALSVKIANETEEGAVAMSGPYQISPNGHLSLEQDVPDVPAYVDFCAGVWKSAIIITNVSFADGSKWEFNESAGRQK